VPTRQESRKPRTALLLTHLPLLRLPKPPVPPLIVLPRLLLLLKAPQTRRSQLQQKLRLAAKQTVKAWNACSRNRCPSSADYKNFI